MDERIVAVGLLTQRDLTLLGPDLRPRVAGRGRAELQRVVAGDRRSRRGNCSALARGRDEIDGLEAVEQPVDGVVGGLLLAFFFHLLGLALERGADELDLLVGQMLDADELLARLVDRAQ